MGRWSVLVCAQRWSVGTISERPLLSSVSLDLQGKGAPRVPKMLNGAHGAPYASASPLSGKRHKK